MKLRVTPALYPEALVLAILALVFVLSWFFDSLRSWYPFIGSYVFSRLMIWYVADVLKVRLERPLMEAVTLRGRSPFDARSNLGEGMNERDYSKMSYQTLRGILKDQRQVSSLSDGGFQTVTSAYMRQIQRKIHIHHFMFGIPLMPVTWILYFYDIRRAFYDVSLSLGMIFAGSTFALFMSEFWHLLTQDWGP